MADGAPDVATLGDRVCTILVISPIFATDSISGADRTNIIFVYVS